MGNMVKYEWRLRKKSLLDVLKGGSVLVILGTFLKKVHDIIGIRRAGFRCGVKSKLKNLASAEHPT
jgi:hypothetical protein